MAPHHTTTLRHAPLAATIRTPEGTKEQCGTTPTDSGTIRGGRTQCRATNLHRIGSLNRIEIERQSRFAVAVMPRRTDAINNIESEGRYRVCSARSRQIAGNRNICAHTRIDANPSDKPFTTRGHSRCAVSSCRLIPHPVRTAPHGRQAIEPHSARSFHAPHTVQAEPGPTHPHTFNL